MYQIVRFYRNPYTNRQVTRKDLTLEEAREHCNDPETSSRTATGSEAVDRTRRVGAWFDGYEQM